jgi:hypothetical protein
LCKLQIKINCVNILYNDLNLLLFNQEYQELLMSEDIMKCRNMKLSDLVKPLCTSNEYCNIKIALAIS